MGPILEVRAGLSAAAHTAQRQRAAADQNQDEFKRWDLPSHVKLAEHARGIAQVGGGGADLLVDRPWRI